jgi:hypothetical protein
MKFKEQNYLKTKLYVQNAQSPQTSDNEKEFKKKKVV